MNNGKVKKNRGFSLLELLIAMAIMLMLLGAAATLLSSALSTRSRESRRTDALTSAQAALNVISRETSNAGYGIIETNQSSNGLVLADCGAQRIHFRANVANDDLITNSPGEDVTYFFDDDTDSIVRYDRYGAWSSVQNKYVPETSVVVNRISSVNFLYFSYTGSNSTPTQTSVPTADTGRVRINVTVTLDPVPGQPNDTVTFTSDVTLRNSNYMLNQY